MAEDATVTECLNQLRKGCVDAAGVLADRLEELGDKRAKVIRTAWSRMIQRCVWWENKDWTRNRYWTRWQAIADERREVRRAIQRVFKRKWKKLPLQAYSPGPKAETTEQ